MQVAGFPHYEVVCSNVLAFYLDPRKEHGLGDLMLRGFLECIAADDHAIPEAKVSREQRTEEGRFLDLLVETPAFVLGIENKIRAPLYNDLDDYARTVREAGRELQVQSHCVLLTLRALSDRDSARARLSGFLPVTYRALIAAVRTRIGHYAAAADTKFLTYCTDFMETLDQLAGSPLDRARSQFFDRRAVEVEAVAAEWQLYRQQRAEAVRTLLKPWPSTMCRQWVYKNVQLVHDFQTLEPAVGKVVSVDLRRDAAHWWILVWPRTADPEYFARQIAPKVVPRQQEDASELVLHLPPTAADPEVAAALDKILTEVAHALGHLAPDD
jgi:hypothetical protein